MKRRPDRASNLRVALAAAAGIVAGAVIAAGLQLGAPDGPPLSARAYGVTGAGALARWAESLGHDVRLIEGRPFRLPPDLAVLFVLQPSAGFSFAEGELEALEGWVRAGGALVLAAEPVVSYPVTRRGPRQYAAGDRSPLQRFGFTLEWFETDAVTATLSRPVSDGAQVGAFQWRQADGPTPRSLGVPGDAVVHARVDGEAILASRPVGKGRVVVLSTTHPFTNQGLREAGNARLILHLLRLAPDGGALGFDEYHHGARQTPTLASWMLTSPAGAGLALAAALAAAFVVWTGRRLGRPYAAPELRIRREPVEYVAAMANLARSAGQRDAVLLRYRETLKRRLGGPYRVAASLPDDAFVAELRAAGAGVDGDSLLRLLRDLEAGAGSAAHFTRLAREASAFTAA